MKKLEKMNLMELKEFYELVENDKAWAGKAFEDVYQFQLDCIDAQILNTVPEVINMAEEIMCDVSKECVEAFHLRVYGEQNIRLISATNLKYQVSGRILVELGLLTPERVDEIYRSTKNKVLDDKN